MLELASLLFIGGLTATAPLVPVSAQVATAPLTKAQTNATVEFIASAFAENYVFADRGKLIAERLRKRLQSGAYAGVDATQLAALLERDIHTVEADRHIEVKADAPASGGAPAPAADRFAWVERLRNRNYDFYKAEYLDGQVGYLDLRSFAPPELAGPTAKAAMTFLANSKAMIIDLRENGGGTGNMVQLLASYFFVDQVTLIRTLRRTETSTIVEDRTLPFFEGQRVPDIPLYILVSKETFSAAESFAFAMQQRGRGVVVGETTKGGANAGRFLSAPNGIRFFVPIAHAMAPNSDKSWDGVGVVPDVPVPADAALREAHRLALTARIERSKDAAERQKLTDTLAGLKDR